jgi:hypothetical protein
MQPLAIVWLKAVLLTILTDLTGIFSACALSGRYKADLLYLSIGKP